MKILALAVLIALCHSQVRLNSRTLRVSPASTFSTLEEAAAVAVAGDTIELSGGQHPGGLSIRGLQGRQGAEIVIRSHPDDIATIAGGNTNLQLSEVAYVVIERVRFRDGLLNGVNIDDGGSFETPSHHVRIENCAFGPMRGSGNNDLLKLSGLDSFLIRSCSFVDGAAGGSGIDMVGCHVGTISGNTFRAMGSNAIQAKGGTQFIRIAKNRFEDCGNRAVNLGGSTGLAFFRPQDAKFEAADLIVCSNLFLGAEAPVAFVGSVRVQVVNNTIWLPGKWVFRILQETVDPDRFVEVGDNLFANNLVVVDQQLSRAVNIGPGTRSETFLIANNLWWKINDASWIPDLPSIELLGVYGVDPDVSTESDFEILSTSAAHGMGRMVPGACLEDFVGQLFADPPSIGARAFRPTMSAPQSRQPMIDLELTSTLKSAREE